MQKTLKDPAKYLASLPDEVRKDMQKLDKEISATMSGLPKVIWEGVFWGGSQQTIIGYGTYTYKDSRGKEGEWFGVGLALQKNYISIYITAVEDKQYVVEKYKDTLGKVKAGKSNISFKKLDDVNLKSLLKLVEKARTQTDPE